MISCHREHTGLLRGFTEMLRKDVSFHETR